MFSIAVLADIVNGTLQKWKELHLIKLALVFAATLAEKVSLQSLGGMLCGIIVRFERGIVKYTLSLFILIAALICVNILNFNQNN